MTRPAATDCDLLVVGSGPIGSTFARLVHDHAPGARILMVEAGPRATDAVGRNVRNVADEVDRAHIRAISQGRGDTATSRGRPGGGGMGPVEGTITARQGTHLVDSQGDMPAAAVSTVVGGQGVHWTGATPRPRDSERIPFIPDSESQAALAEAEALLSVSDRAYPDSRPARAVRRVLGELFDPLLPPDRRVAPIPIAARVESGGHVYWTGPESILEPLVSSPRFELRAETLCRRLLAEDGRIAGAELEDLSTGAHTPVTARAVVVAADGLRTPQLLWASGIRPSALGRYLTEHPLLFGVVALRDELVRQEPLDDDVLADLPWTPLEPIGAMIGVPFADPDRPFHAQIMLMGVPPVPAPPHLADAPAYVIVGWGCRKEPRRQDRVAFSETGTDDFGMPRMRISYSLSERDQAEIAQARREQARAAEALGPWLPGCEPALAPAGTSLHYQGTVRMGATDDGTSVCDDHGAVWGLPNLFVGGNGVIPTATACNPTLTSVALAVRSAERVLKLVGASSPTEP